MSYNYALERYSYGYGRAEGPETVDPLPATTWADQNDDNEDTEWDELPHGEHGTAYKYRWARCRCQKCRSQKARDSKKYRQKRKRENQP